MLGEEGSVFPVLSMQLSRASQKMLTKGILKSEAPLNPAFSHPLKVLQLLPGFSLCSGR